MSNGEVLLLTSVETVQNWPVCHVKDLLLDPLRLDSIAWISESHILMSINTGKNERERKEASHEPSRSVTLA